MLSQKLEVLPSLILTNRQLKPGQSKFSTHALSRLYTWMTIASHHDNYSSHHEQRKYRDCNDNRSMLVRWAEDEHLRLMSALLSWGLRTTQFSFLEEFFSKKSTGNNSVTYSSRSLRLPHIYLYEVCPKSIRTFFISARQNCRATSAGHERVQ